MEKAVGPVFLLAALTACLSQEVTVEISSDCFGTKTATVEFQTIQVDKGFNYNRNYIGETCHDSDHATTLDGANVAECALNSYAANMNSFSFANNACVGYPFWQANLTDCRLDEGQKEGVLLYLADSKLSNYSACPSNFYKTKFGCVSTSETEVKDTEGDSACSQLGASFYSAQSVDEFMEFQTELTATSQLGADGIYFWVDLHYINGTWIWHGTGVEQPLLSDNDPGIGSVCAVLIREENWFLSLAPCMLELYALCIIRG